MKDIAIKVVSKGGNIYIRLTRQWRKVSYQDGEVKVHIESGNSRIVLEGGRVFQRDAPTEVLKQGRRYQDN